MSEVLQIPVNGFQMVRQNTQPPPSLHFINIMLKRAVKQIFYRNAGHFN